MGRGAGKGGEGAQWMDKKPLAVRLEDVSQQKISWEEVRKHRRPDDAWMVYRNKVYDVSGWHDHPGGAVIFTHAGDDFTDIFAAFHPPTAYAVLEPFYIGDLDDKSAALKPTKQAAFEKAYRELRSKLLTMGLFNASMTYYVWKCVSTMLVWAAAVACVVFFEGFWMHMLGATIMALFWQQCGWLAHDFLHHQVFKNRALGDAAGVYWGNLAQGFSVGWWKMKHNSHHAVPNLHESAPEAHDGDPDMDTMPLLAWSLDMARTAEESKLGRFMVGHQALFYFPILLLARISWALQSFFFVFDAIAFKSPWEVKSQHLEKKKMGLKEWEMAGLTGHYLWLAMLAWQMPAWHALCFVLASQCITGLLLALVFGLGHNGMATYAASERPDFWKLQVTTTRNVTGSWLVHWFCGGLQYQVDHHLFPQIPRHNLPKVHTLVESFCRENGVSYHEASMWQGTVEVLQHLGQVSRDFISEFPAM